MWSGTDSFLLHSLAKAVPSCNRFQSSWHPVFMNMQAHGDKKATQGWFRVQSIQCAKQRLPPLHVCFFAFCCFSSHPSLFSAQSQRAFSLCHGLSSFSSSEQLHLFQDVTGTLWEQRERTPLGSHICISYPSLHISHFLSQCSSFIHYSNDPISLSQLLYNEN